MDSVSQTFLYDSSTSIPQVFFSWGEGIINKAFSISLSNNLLFYSYYYYCIRVVMNI